MANLCFEIFLLVDAATPYRRLETQVNMSLWTSIARLLFVPMYSVGKRYPTGKEGQWVNGLKRFMDGIGKALNRLVWKRFQGPMK